MSIDQRTLMQYFDGELGDEQAAEVEALLEHDPEARRVLEGLDQVGAVVRGVMLDQARPPDDLSDAVMARISAEPSLARAAAPATSIGRTKGWREQPVMRRVVPIALASLAAAAALALVFQRAHAPEPRVAAPSRHLIAPRARPAVSPPPSARPELELASAESAPAIAIETVDFGGREGTIFMLAEGEMATPVVWLMDEPGGGRDTMEPL